MASFMNDGMEQAKQRRNMQLTMVYVCRGDPIILSMAAVLFLEKEQVHFWDDIGYRVAGYFTHCPADYKQCSCRPQENFDNDGYSCLGKF